MNQDDRRQAYTLGGAGLALGLLVGLIITANQQGRQAVPPPPPPPGAEVNNRGLDANLWMQTSGEYDALCQQTYRLAGRRLAEKVKQKDKEKPAAVVLDLDETVFDNSPFQTHLVENNLAFSDELWASWERDYPEQVKLVPGAGDFLKLAASLRVRPVFITNRLKKYKASTVRALKANGIDTEGIDARLLLADEVKDDPNANDKSARRERVRKQYEVLLWVGDNLRDFAEDDFKAPRGVNPDDPVALRDAIQSRRRHAAASNRWGDDWFILPNPAYGEWMKLQGNRPAAVLNRWSRRGGVEKN